MGSWLTCLVISYCFLTLYRNEGNFVQGEDLAIKNASENNYKYAEPTVMIAILVRNKAHILPWFFGHLEKLNYPKNRISFWWVLLIFFFFFSKKCFYAFLLLIYKWYEQPLKRVLVIFHIYILLCCSGSEVTTMRMTLPGCSGSGWMPIKMFTTT